MTTDEITTAFADVGQKQDGRATRLDHIVKGGHRLPHIPPGVLIRPTGSARQRINNDQADDRSNSRLRAINRADDFLGGGRVEEIDGAGGLDNGEVGIGTSGSPQAPSRGLTSFGADKQHAPLLCRPIKQSLATGNSHSEEHCEGRFSPARRARERDQGPGRDNSVPKPAQGRRRGVGKKSERELHQAPRTAAKAPSLVGKMRPSCIIPMVPEKKISHLSPEPMMAPLTFP